MQRGVLWGLIAACALAIGACQGEQEANAPEDFPAAMEDDAPDAETAPMPETMPLEELEGTNPPDDLEDDPGAPDEEGAEYGGEGEAGAEPDSEVVEPQ